VLLSSGYKMGGLGRNSGGVTRSEVNVAVRRIGIGAAHDTAAFATETVSSVPTTGIRQCSHTVFLGTDSVVKHVKTIHSHAFSMSVRHAGSP